MIPPTGKGRISTTNPPNLEPLTNLFEFCFPQHPLLRPGFLPLALCFILFGATIARAQATRAILTDRIIVLDAGHATKNNAGEIINAGANSRSGVLERDVALAVSSKTAALLEAQGAKVYQTRTSDNPWRYAFQRTEDNRARAIFANTMRAEAYVRLHFDWNLSPKYEGVSSFYFRWGSRELAKALHRSMMVMLGRRDNGLKRRSFVSMTSRMPTVLLELGVLSNPAEASLLPTEEYQQKAAEAIVRGLADYFTYKEKGQLIRLDSPADTPENAPENAPPTENSDETPVPDTHT